MPAHRGASAHGRIPRHTASNSTLIAAMTIDELGAAMVLDGATDTLAFEAYVEHCLVPTLWRGHVVVLDKLSAHTGTRVRELISGARCDLWYLPSYSPDLSPIEEACSKRKTLLRRAAARTKEALLDAIGVALGQITPSDAHGSFTHCGFQLPQPTDH
jgi:transposase